ncbi:hypothetical protein PCYB_126270 [Plasmodium cynomolgi strain B]|uniref:Uncharacterized protein n=1 Tax=Plasmodium cynomolgi (strain B) TaxID=1120755 RepID=K6VFJ7_PLACD|nr:hypothetical protein PCYB_126270 [Plasmodium cynomolgi strain B]GAB68062.1 hypothetical protein PCYB_126270 [Plasmodium cynomolgi strain B]
MDNLFTININPDKNVRLNTNTEKNQLGNFGRDREGLTVPPDEEYNKNNGNKNNTNDNNNNHCSVEEDEVITLEMDQISTNDSFDMLEELNENQINDYENMRKKIRAHILTSFQKDNILIEGPEHLEQDSFFKEHKLERNENKLLKLRKDKIYLIVSSASQERNKRSRQNEASNRYYYDPNVIGEDKPGDYDNFVDVLLGREAPRKGSNPPSKGVVAVKEEREKNAATDAGEENAATDAGVENAATDSGEENAAIDAGVENTGDDSIDQVGTVEIEEKTVQEEDPPPVVIENAEGGTPKKGTTDESAEFCAERCVQTCEEICPDDSKSNHVVDDFREKIKNWLVKFPDINSENLFFHFYFQSELYKEKKYTCQNCGSSDCDRELTFRHVCRNTYCFLCYKRVTGPICHNTKAQYVAFKANTGKLINDLKYIQYPYKSMSCLNCFSNDHLKCGRPPYIYAKHTYNVRREYNSKLDPSYFVYLRNPRNIWILHEPKTNEQKGNNDGDNNALRNVDNQSGQNSSSGGNGGGSGGGYGRGGEHGNRRNNRRGSENSQTAANQERVGAALHNRHKDDSNFSSNHNVYMVEDKHSYDSSKRKVILTKYSFNDNAQRNKQKRNYNTYDQDSQNNFHSNNKRHKNDAHQSSSYYDYKNKQQVRNDKHDNISDFYQHGGKHGNGNRDNDQYSSRHHNKNRYIHDNSIGDYYNNDDRGQDNRNNGNNHPGSYYNLHNETNDGAKGYTSGQMYSARAGLYKFSNASSGQFSNPRGGSSMKPNNANFHVNKNNSHSMYSRHPNNQHYDNNPKRNQSKGNHGSYSGHNSNVALHKHNDHSGNGLANNKGGNTLYKNTYKNVHPDRGGYHDYR